MTETATGVWAELSGQPRVVQYLTSAKETGRLAHAYLFLGPPGSGKKTAALAMAASLNCAHGGCGSCDVCVRTLDEIHPDVMMVEPEGMWLTIEQTRQASAAAALTPVEARYRVFVIDQADRMTQEAANAFLKTLEDPPPNVVFILLAEKLERLLPTIQSRCQAVPFATLGADKMRRLLVDVHRLSPRDADLATRVSNSVLGEALAFVRSDARKSRRKAVLDLAEKLPELNELELARAAEWIVGEVKNAGEALKQSQKAEAAGADEMAGGQLPAAVKKRLQDKHRRETSRQELHVYGEILGVLGSWYRDLLVLAEEGDEELVVNIDRLGQIKAQSGKADVKRLLEALMQVARTEEYMRYNVNMHLAFEVLLFRLRDVWR